MAVSFLCLIVGASAMTLPWLLHDWQTLRTEPSTLVVNNSVSLPHKSHTMLLYYANKGVVATSFKLNLYLSIEDVNAVEPIRSYVDVSYVK